MIWALCVVAVMAAVALTVLGAMASSFRDAVLREDTEQARLYAIGAGHWAVVHLTDAVELGNADILAPDFGQSIVFADGRISVTVRDGANCFNVNALLASVGSITRRRAEVIFTSLVGDSGLRSALIPALRDSRANIGLFADLADLAAVEGSLDPNRLSQLAEHVCMRPDTDLRPLNLNTLKPDQADLLAAYARSSDTGAAQRLVQARPVGGFTVLEDALGDPFFAGDAETSLISITSTIHDIQVSVRYGDAAVSMVTTVERTGSTMHQLSRKFIW